MRIRSPAGELDVVIGETMVEGGYAVVEAGVGIWEIEVFLGPDDFKFFLSVLFKPGVMIMLLKHFLMPGARKTRVPDEKGVKNGNKEDLP